VKKLEGADQLAATATALEKIRQDLQTHFQTLEREAQAALDASTKQRDEAQAQQAALAKQVDEAQKASDTATAANRDAEATLARGQEAIESSNKSVEAANRKQEQCQAKLAGQDKLRAEAAQHANEQRPRFALAAFAPDASRLLLADEGGRLFVYDAQSFAPLDAWDAAPAAPVAAMFVDNADFVLAAREAGDNGKVTRWSAVPTWRLKRTIGNATDPGTLADRVLSLAFSSDGSLLATGSGEPSRSGQIHIWNVSDGSLVRSIHQPHSDTVFALAFSPDGEHLASASADRTAKVVRIANGELVRTFEGHTDHVTGVSWRANGKQLATSSSDHKIKVWDFELGEQKRTIEAGSKEVTGVAFAGIGGQLVSSSGDRNVRIHNADDGKAVRTLAGATSYLFCCAATETGNAIVAGGADRVLRVWNGVDGAELLKIGPRD
jgi:WD40 repeat protein